MIGKHVQEDLLELYAMKRLQAEEVDRIDDHLFVCEDCRCRLVETERYISGFRLAARKLNAENGQQRLSPWEWLWGSLSPRSGLAALAACASLAIVLAIGNQDRRPIQYLDVTLQATRGIESTLAAASGRVRYRLHLDATGIQIADRAIVTVANGTGVEITREYGNRIKEREVVAALGLELKPGSYFVRLASEVDPARTLREYNLEVE